MRKRQQGRSRQRHRDEMRRRKLARSVRATVRYQMAALTHAHAGVAASVLWGTSTPEAQGRLVELVDRIGYNGGDALEMLDRFARLEALDVEAEKLGWDRRSREANLSRRIEDQTIDAILERDFPQASDEEPEDPFNPTAKEQEGMRQWAEFERTVIGGDLLAEVIDRVIAETEKHVSRLRAAVNQPVAEGQALHVSAPPSTVPSGGSSAKLQRNLRYTTDQ